MEKRKIIAIEVLCMVLFAVIACLSNNWYATSDGFWGLILTIVGFVIVIISTGIKEKHTNNSRIIYFVATFILLLTGILLMLFKAPTSVSISILASVIVLYIIFYLIIPKE